MARATHLRWVAWRSRFARFALALGAVTIPACRVTDLPLWGPGGPAFGTFEVERIRDVEYVQGPVADAHRHRLDLFLPKGHKDYPVVVLVHGGAWMVGDNRCCGLYSSLGEFLASRGVGAVLPNYRLSPRAKHPEHITDIARAVAWTQAHIAEHGGRPEQMFLAGHSAGGHLVALLATDPTYLEAVGLTVTDVKGVIAVSGVYDIPAGKLEVTLGGAPPRAFRFDEVVPLRGGSGRTRPPCAWLPGIPLSVNVFGPAFGNDPHVREDASPRNHVRPGLPPFLLFSAENDLPTLPEMAEDFHKALREQGCDACLVKVKDRNHNSVMFSAITEADPVGSAMLEFVRRHAGRAILP